MKFIELLTDIGSVHELYKLLIADHNTTRGAELQIPLVLHVILVEQEKCRGFEVEHTMRVASWALLLLVLHI